MPFNVNGGWGRIAADSIFSNSPKAGNRFLVIASTNANWDKYTSMLPANPAGPVAVHATLQAAIDACTDSQDDVIYVADGHTETVTAAGGLDVNKIGVSIVGLGKGNRRPTINFTTATTADMDVDAEGVSFENLIFDLTGVDALVGPIDVNAANASFKKCLFRTADADGQAVVGIVTDANADGLLVQDCYAVGSTDAGTTSFIRIVGGDEIVIKDNIIEGAFRITSGGIEATTTAPGYLVVQGNVIRNLTAASTRAMNFVSGTRALIVNNRLAVRSGTTPISVNITGSSTMVGFINTIGNYYTNVTAITPGVLL